MLTSRAAAVASAKASRDVLEMGGQRMAKDPIGFSASEIEELTREAYIACEMHHHRHLPTDEKTAELLWQNLPPGDIGRYGRLDIRAAVYAVLRRSREMMLARMAGRDLPACETRALNPSPQEMEELVRAADTAHYAERCANDCAYTDWWPVVQAVLRRRKEQLLLREALEMEERDHRG